MNMTNEYVHLFKAAVVDFKRNKVRTFLTSLGIMIGVLSVVMLIALGLGLKNYIKQQFEDLGTNLIIIFPGSGFGGGSEEGDGGGFGSFGPGLIGGAEFDERDVQSLDRISVLDYVVPVFFKNTTIESQGEKKSGYIQGTSQEAFTVMNIKPLEGRIFDRSDVQTRKKLTVLGHDLAEKLYKDPSNAIGKTVRFENQRFSVIGVAEKKGDNEMDNSVIIPYTTTFGSLNPNKTFFTIYLGVQDEGDIETAKEEAKNTLLKRYDEEDFSVTEQSEILSAINQIFTMLNAVLVGIGSISLLVGGIGIMNIMYATVTERTKEIGITRAVGATQRDILSQFLAESVILSVFGGAMGLALATIIVLAIQRFFPAEINLFAVIVTLLISTGIGVFFGVFPARRAAKLPPIEAIRYE